MRRIPRIIHALCGIGAALALAGCSSTRHVPDGTYLLDKVSITVADSTRLTTKPLYNYLRQTPNHKALGFARIQLGVYNLAGNDSTSRFNRWLRKIGEEPVILDAQLTEQSARQLRQALINSGYNDAHVEVEIAERGKKKRGVNYRLFPGSPHMIGSVSYEVDDPVIEELIMADSISWPVKAGGVLDRNVLDAQRTLIVERLRNNGYFAFTKEHISFIADTTAGSKNADLTMVLHNPKPSPGAQTPAADGPKKGLEEALAAANLPHHRKYVYNKVVVVPDFSPGDNSEDFNFAARDTVNYDGLEILYGPDPYLRSEEHTS